MAGGGTGGVAAQDRCPDRGPKFRDGLSKRGGKHVGFDQDGHLVGDVLGFGAQGGDFRGGQHPAPAGGGGAGQPAGEVVGLVQPATRGALGAAQREGDFDGEVFLQAGIVAGQLREVGSRSGLEMVGQCFGGDDRLQKRLRPHRDPISAGQAAGGGRRRVQYLPGRAGPIGQQPGTVGEIRLRGLLHTRQPLPNGSQR